MRTVVLGALLLISGAGNGAGEGVRITTLYDDTVRVGPARFRTLDIPLPVEPARIIGSYEMTEGLSGVRLVLLRKEDAERWLRGEAHETEAATPFGRRGGISYRPREPDHYVLVLDNRLEGREAAEVRLLVRVVYGDEGVGPVRIADPRKGQILVWSAMALFAGVALFAGGRIRRNVERRG